MAEKGEEFSKNAHNLSHKVSSVAQNKFSNDGSFLEMFKRKMEAEKEKQSSDISKKQTVNQDQISHSQSFTNLNVNKDNLQSSETSLAGNAVKKPGFPFVGKRRGATPVLKTGAVKKRKSEEGDSAPSDKKDAWSKYLEEVKKYKSQSCQDEDKTRPLVK